MLLRALPFFPSPCARRGSLLHCSSPRGSHGVLLSAERLFPTMPSNPVFLCSRGPRPCFPSLAELAGRPLAPVPSLSSPWRLSAMVLCIPSSRARAASCSSVLRLKLARRAHLSVSPTLAIVSCLVAPCSAVVF
ncbi:uncharacterized protein [Zea mays]|uniref:Uncharacterized protein n=1 Tax=Zea mays TaxID=4577 RepID=C0PNQ5_MAIZE|nr:uncharacterized protein LOC100384367 [Zea mays]XP_008656928.1 uncharacterized protein LOC103636343 [Zea mays]ACN36821.1 unknown [Zea mays]|eukprot:NP_001170384.1 uncharacterized protein LOC100384367 [Zea mays]